MSALRISNDISEMDIPLIHQFLATESYWARGLQFETLTKSLSHSLCFAGFVGEKQVAFGRAITDRALVALKTSSFCPVIADAAMAGNWLRQC